MKVSITKSVNIIDSNKELLKEIAAKINATETTYDPNDEESTGLFRILIKSEDGFVLYVDGMLSIYGKQINAPDPQFQYLGRSCVVQGLLVADDGCIVEFLYNSLSKLTFAKIIENEVQE